MFSCNSADVLADSRLKCQKFRIPALNKNLWLENKRHLNDKDLPPGIFTQPLLYAAKGCQVVDGDVPLQQKESANNTQES